MKNSKSKFKLILIITLVIIVLSFVIGLFVWKFYSYETFRLVGYQTKIDIFDLGPWKGINVNPIKNAMDAKFASVEFWNKAYGQYALKYNTTVDKIKVTDVHNYIVCFDKTVDAWFVSHIYNDVEIRSVIFKSNGEVLAAWKAD